MAKKQKKGKAAKVKVKGGSDACAAACGKCPKQTGDTSANYAARVAYCKQCCVFCENSSNGCGKSAAQCSKIVAGTFCNAYDPGESNPKAHGPACYYGCY